MPAGWDADGCLYMDQQELLRGFRPAFIRLALFISILFPGTRPLLGQDAPLRLRSEIEHILGPVDTAGQGNPRPLRLVWVYSRPAEGGTFHHFEDQMNIWKALFATAGNVAFEPAEKWPSPLQWQGADLVVFNFRLGANMSDAQYRDLDAYLDRGKGFVPVHVGVALQDGSPARYAPYAGLSWEWGRAVDRAGRIVLRNQPDHALAARLPDSMVFKEEMYWNLLQDTAGFRALNTSRERFAPASATDLSFRAYPAMWTKLVRKGKVFGCVVGHFTETHDDPLFRLLLLRGMAWAAGEPSERFRTLVTRGARIKEDVTLAWGRMPVREPVPGVIRFRGGRMEIRTLDRNSWPGVLWTDAAGRGPEGARRQAHPE